MGKGDKKSKRGKIVIGSFGVRRSGKKRRATGISQVRNQVAAVVEKEEILPEIAEITEVKVKTAKPKKKSESGETSA
jgi:ribosomal small subunit protein bTHX